VDIDPAAVGETLGRDFKKAQKKFREALARQFTLGRQLSLIREELGDKVFWAWLKRYCPDIRRPEAEALMRYSVESDLARRVDRVLDS
jgi:hypothetical protein